jgi:hypothetical protein
MTDDEAADAFAHQLRHQGGHRGWTLTCPGKGIQPFGSGIEPNGEPVAGDRAAGAQVVRAVGDRHPEHDSRCTGGEREPDRVGLLEAARDLERYRHPRRDRADRVQVHRVTAPCTVDIDEMDGPRALANERIGDSFRTIGGHALTGGRARPVNDP